MRPIRSLLLTATALLGLALGPAPARADILWDFRGASPVEVGAADHIRVGTLSGPWALVVQYLGRPAVADAGWRTEYRTAASAPYGWSVPVAGVDAQGLPAAVRSPLPPPPPDEGEPDLVQALGALAGRIRTERLARITAATGSVEEQLWQISRAMQVQAAIAADTATANDRAELADLLVRAAYVDAVRRYGWTPEVPPMWGAASAGTALYAWAEANVSGPAAVAAIDPASPPVAAPQWPVLAQ